MQNVAHTILAGTHIQWYSSNLGLTASMHAQLTCTLGQLEWHLL